MNEQQIQNITNAVANALRQCDTESCCGPEPARTAAAKTVHVDVSACCGQDSETSEAPRVVCICIGDKGKC